MLDESALILPASNPRHLPENPIDVFLFSCNNLDDEELFDEMLLANNAASEFLDGKINCFDYMDALEHVGIPDPLEILSEIIEPYVHNGLIL